MAITRNFQLFQYFNFETDFLENENFFQKPGVPFLVESTKIENASFPYKTAILEANIKTDVIVSTKWTNHKERSLASNYSIFWKFCFTLRTSFCKRWSFIWCCFFPVAYYIWTLSYRDRIYFEYLCSCLLLGLLFYNHFYFYYNWSNNVIKTATLFYLDNFVRSSASWYSLPFTEFVANFSVVLLMKHSISHPVSAGRTTFSPKFWKMGDQKKMSA